MLDNQDIQNKKKQEENDINFLRGLSYGFGVSVLTAILCFVINNFSYIFISIVFLTTIGIASFISKNKRFIIGFIFSTIILYFMGNMMWSITCGGVRFG